MSRTNNSIKNLFTSFTSEIIIIFLKFATRSVFINILGSQFLGLNGLFTNILSILSLAELGIGSAITFNLYKPIADKDYKTISLLMKLYKKTFTVIGFTVFLMGIILIPFLPHIIKDDTIFINVNFVFLLYLFQTVSTYLFFAYKRTIIKAHQKEHIVSIITTVFAIISNIIQIIVLLVFKKYELFIITLILSNILQNLIIAIKSDRMYPYLKNNIKDELPKDEKKEIYKNIYANFIYKINNVILNSTDNILLSSFIGLTIVGLYSNYLLIITAIKTILNKSFNAIIASLGDLYSSNNKESEYLIFKVINFFTMYSYGLAAIGIFVVANPFIKLWIGDDYVLSQVFVALLSIEIYVLGIHKKLSTFRTAMGLFQQAKYRPILGIIINLVLSMFLLKIIGLYGVLIGTIFSIFITFICFDPYIIYKNVFKKSVLEYYVVNIKYVLVLGAAGYLSNFISNSTSLEEGFLSVVSQSLICVFITSLVVYIFFRNTQEVKYLKQTLQNYIIKLRKQ